MTTFAPTTSDPLVVEHLMCHRQASTTERYIHAAVPEMVERAIRSIDTVDSHGSKHGSTAWQSEVEPPLPSPKFLNRMERETGVEPATFSLGSDTRTPQSPKKSIKTGTS